MRLTENTIVRAWITQWQDENRGAGSYSVKSAMPLLEERQQQLEPYMIKKTRSSSTLITSSAAADARKVKAIEGIILTLFPKMNDQPVSTTLAQNIMQVIEPAP
jgi:hypothetical protein